MRAVDMVIYDGDRVAIFRSPCTCKSDAGGVRYTSDLFPGQAIKGPIHCTLFVQDSDAALVSFHVPQSIWFSKGQPIVLEIRTASFGISLPLSL